MTLELKLIAYFNLSRYFVDGDVQIPEIFRDFDPLETGYIDYITWSMMLSPKVRNKLFCHGRKCFMNASHNCFP